MWRALKGEANKFGIVTHFDLVVFPPGQLYGGFLIQSISSREQVFKAFADIAFSPSYDIRTSTTVAFDSLTKTWIIVHLPTVYEAS